jgi:hypothetical protein
MRPVAPSVLNLSGGPMMVHGVPTSGVPQPFAAVRVKVSVTKALPTGGRGGRGGRGRHPGRARPEVALDRRCSEHMAVHGDVVDAAPEASAGRRCRPAAQRVAADPPPAGGHIRQTGRSFGDQHAVDVQPHHAVTDGADCMVPAVVVHGRSRARHGEHRSGWEAGCPACVAGRLDLAGTLGAGVGAADAEVQLAVGAHVEMAVGSTRGPGAGVAEADDLAGPGERGAEPGFHGEGLGPEHPRR